jgi:6-phosphofructokinase
VLATRFGVKAYEMIVAGEWGRMASLEGVRVTSVPLEDAVREVKKLDEEIYHVAEIFFG